MNEMKIKIDPEQVVDVSNFVVEIKKLTCSICYCLLRNPKVCYNKKCKQIFCSDCIENSKTPEGFCPFCKYCPPNRESGIKLEYSQSTIDNNLLFILQNVKLICKHIDCHNKIFTLGTYLKHLQETKTEVSKCSDESHGDMEWNTLRCCASCNAIHCRLCENLSLNNWVVCCNKCKNNDSVTTETISKSTDMYKCTSCLKKIKCIFDPFQIYKCAICHDIFCNKCAIMCPICKEYICHKDIKCCDHCMYQHINSYQCINCYNNEKDLHLFKECKKCNKSYCINCVDICNACSEILCCSNKHKCESCEDNVCDLHLYDCLKCKNGKKVCMRRCTYTCQYCYEKSTVFCDEKIHNVLSTAVFHCPHQICKQCIDKCAICKTENCQICDKSRITRCDICLGKLCSNCIQFCINCYKNYCTLHKCIVCNEEMNGCFYCFVDNNKNICNLCEKDLRTCPKCEKLLICSYGCYKKYKLNENVSHICRMFVCEECEQEHESKEILEELNSSNNLRIGKRRRFIDNIGGSESDKVMINCEESCVCVIY